MSAFEPVQAVTRLDTRRTYLPPTDTYDDDLGIDWIAVERATRGELPHHPLTHNELREAALWLTRTGVPRNAISTRLSVYEYQIREWEAEAGLLPDNMLCTRDDCRHARRGRDLCANHLAAFRVREKQWKAALAELGKAA